MIFLGCHIFNFQSHSDSTFSFYCTLHTEKKINIFEIVYLFHLQNITPVGFDEYDGYTNSITINAKNAW